jgi:hypothetical protein
MKTINIKGKEYITVNERLIHFRTNNQYTNWQISEEIISLDDKEGIFKVSISNQEGYTVSSAHAQEYRDSSYINKTSFVENGFTSALGRALGYLGIGIDTSIASADEVQNAVNNQKSSPSSEKKAINSVKDEAYVKAAEYIKNGGKIEAIKQKYELSSSVESKLKSL